jgi:hypothetical protein
LTFEFTAKEWEPLEGLPILEIVNLAADLDICAPAEIDRRALLAECVTAIVARARTEGLPFSKYDEHDLAGLTPSELAAVAQLQGVSPTVRAVMKRGLKVYRQYVKHRPDNPVALMLPMLLTAVARAAQQTAPAGC